MSPSFIKGKKMVEVKIETKKTNIGELATRIEALHGKEKQVFCKTLSVEEKKQYINYIKDRDSEEIEVIFRCYEPMGGMVKFTAFPYENVGGTYELYDNQSIKLPICLAKRFNNEFQGIGTFYPTHAYVMDAKGSPILGVGKKTYRFGANSTSLM